MEKLKRSEKYKIFRDYGVPRYMMIDLEERKREQRLCAFVAFMMLVLAIAGKTEAQRTFGLLALFISSLVGVFNR